MRLLYGGNLALILFRNKYRHPLILPIKISSHLRKPSDLGTIKESSLIKEDLSSAILKYKNDNPEITIKS